MSKKEWLEELEGKGEWIYPKLSGLAKNNGGPKKLISEVYDDGFGEGVISTVIGVVGGEILLAGSGYLIKKGIEKYKEFRKKQEIEKVFDELQQR